MAKKRPPRPVPSKSDAIRAILAEHPKAGTKDIKSKLSAKGIKASDALINKIKYAPKAGTVAKRGRASRGSKAEAIRGMFDQLGLNARPRDVVEALRKKGITVTAAQVSMLRSKQSSNGKSPASAAAHAVPFDHLLAAKQLAARLGGVEQARQALESFARLVQN